MISRRSALLQARRIEDDLRRSRRVRVASNTPLAPLPITRNEVGLPIPPVLSEQAANRRRDRAVPAAYGDRELLLLSRRGHRDTLADDDGMINADWNQSAEARACEDVRARGSAGGSVKHNVPPNSGAPRLDQTHRYRAQLPCLADSATARRRSESCPPAQARVANLSVEPALYHLLNFERVRTLKPERR